MQLLRWLFFLVLIFYPFSNTSALIRHVPSDYNSIQDGIDAAIDGDTVLVAPGIYSGTGNYEISFFGKEILVTSLMGPDSTIIDAEWQNGVYFRNGETDLAIFSGFKLVHTFTAILIEGSSPVIMDCVIDSSEAWIWGGSAIDIFAFSAPVIMNCSISNCYDISSQVFGPAMVISTSSPLVIDCVFFNNYSALQLGPIYCSTGWPTFMNCTFSNNDPYGISSGDNPPNLLNCIVWGNSAGSTDNHSDFNIEYSNFEGGWPGEGNIDDDPLFINPDSDDYRLSSSSPCIDTGDPDSPNVPWGGFRRDMGAFEYDLGYYFDGHNIILKPFPIEIPTLEWR